MVGQHVLPYWNTAGRPKNARPGTLGFNVQTRSLECWNGYTWLKLPMKKFKYYAGNEADKMSENSQVFIAIGQGLFTRMGPTTIPSWNTAGRPKNARPGTLGFNVQTRSLEHWDGNDWLAVSMNRK